MESIFAALTKRQSMLLLTSVTFGGQGALEDFKLLPEEESELLTHRAQQLLALPRDRRIPLLVQEIKRLVTARRGQLWATEPARLARALQAERPALVEVVLRALPAGLADATRALLPDHVPVGGAVKEVRPEILSLIRWKLEVGVSKDTERTGFKFSDVVYLRTRDLMTVCDRLGANALAPAVAGLPEEEREPFFSGLHPDQRTLLRAAVEGVDAGAAMSAEDAKAFVEGYEHGKGPADLLRNAGTHRLARALVAQSAEFAQRVLERQSGDFGATLSRWIREEKPKITGRIDAGRADIVVDLERLAAAGVVDRPVKLPVKRTGELPKVVSGKQKVPAGPISGNSQVGSASGVGRSSEVSMPSASGLGSLPAPRLGRDEGRAPSGSHAASGRREPTGREVPEGEPSVIVRRDLMAERVARQAGLPVGTPGSLRPSSRPSRSVSTPPPSPSDDRSGVEGSISDDAPAAAHRVPIHADPGGSSISRVPSLLDKPPRRKVAPEASTDASVPLAEGADEKTDPGRPENTGTGRTDTTGRGPSNDE